MAQFVYRFSAGQADGSSEMKNLLGGKGANLAEMSRLGIPVPPGFTITTDVCTAYYENDHNFPDGLDEEVDAALDAMAEEMGSGFGDVENPLLVSVRSGARQSMPGMMETVLNVGLTTATIPALVEKTDNERFVYDAYRRLITMYSDVVMEKAAGVEPKGGKSIRSLLDAKLEAVKEANDYATDADLQVDDLKALCDDYKKTIEEELRAPFPDDARRQLSGAVRAVFQSWNGKRAIDYRRIESIPHEWGTAVNVQAMVFGNMGDTSATGVAFTRNPATGENVFYGEWLPNAQGEDVVAGIRTPYGLNPSSQTEANRDLPTMEASLPESYAGLEDVRKRLEEHYHDMQDIEFTIQEGRLWMLQTRTGKRNGMAALKIAMEMVEEGMIDREEAIRRVRPDQLNELLHPMIDPEAEHVAVEMARGLPAGPGGGVGKIVLSADHAEVLAERGEQVILVRNETSPEDVHGMHVAAAIVTAKGGMTSHAAVVARGWGKTCVVGCGALRINEAEGTVTIDDRILREGDVWTVNGSTGALYEGALPLIEIDPEKNEHLATFLGWCDEVRRLGVRANADTPEDAARARHFGAQGIGLCRTEHMFFGEERIKVVREMIMARNAEEREEAVMKLLPYQKEDFLGIFKAMEGLPVTVRLLDPPLHEFMPPLDDLDKVREVGKTLGKSAAEMRERLTELHELNPMLGHRGCRLGISHPEISRMQARAILEAVAELQKEGRDVRPEIMVPLVGTVEELRDQKRLLTEVAEEVKREVGVDKISCLVGTMIEVPRAALTADEIASEAEFFSFGTNDLTQMTCAFSRDDIGSFLPLYMKKGIYPINPFISLDQAGVGQLVAIAVERGRSTRPDLKVGICGEHGGDPASIGFFHRTGLDYVSCSPFRVPIARLAAAQSKLTET